MKGVSGKPEDPLGRIVFSPERTDGAPRDEENTQEEEAIFSTIYDHVFSNSQVSQKEAERLFKYVTNPSYSDYFYPPPNSEVYRGLHIRPFNAWLLKKWLGNITEIPEFGEAEGSWTMGSRDTSFTSYTTNLENAKRFCHWDKKLPGLSKKEGTEFYSVIFVAQVSDNPGKFLDVTPFYESIDKFGSIFGDEQETIGLGKINVGKILWKLRK